MEVYNCKVAKNDNDNVIYFFRDDGSSFKKDLDLLGCKLALFEKLVQMAQTNKPMLTRWEFYEFASELVEDISELTNRFP